MAGRWYKKLFYDLDAANAFGTEVDAIAIADEAMVPAGRSGASQSVFRASTVGKTDEIAGAGTHYVIEKDLSNRTRDVYYLSYRIEEPRGSAKADVEIARRSAEAYLDQKYAEICPGAGMVYR